MKDGILLVNLGTPEQPSAKAVKAFLSEFLHDHRVVDMSRWIWCPLLHGVILPVRAPKVAKLYQSIWFEGGSPLLVYSQRQAKKLTDLVDVPVALGMTYGTPSLLSGLTQLVEQGVEKITVIPLYPQYSGTTTGAVEDALERAVKQLAVRPECCLVNNYHAHPLYIKALAGKVREYWQQNGQGDYLLCSFHGIPQRFADNGDIYPLHCQRTTELLAAELGLTEQQMGMSYQSRFGKEEWLKPYTDKTLQKLAGNGTKRVDIMTPAFSSDCLETLEEIAQECKEIFIEAGGENYHYIPCLNDDDAHISMMEQLFVELR